MRPAYTSEITAFVAQLKQQDSTLDARQRAGRELLWQRANSPEQEAQMEQGNLHQKS